MKEILRFAAAVLAFSSWILTTGCETTMAAKSGPESLKSRQANACERMQDRRSDCNDEAGCHWDTQANQCVEH